VHQVAISSPVDSALSSDDAAIILLSMQRERCAIFDALGIESAAQAGTVLPMFDGGDPLGKTAPSTERAAFDPLSVINPYLAYSDAELAYIVGYDQATAECFVANIRPTLPAADDEVAVLATFADPVTPTNDAEVAAMEAGLAGC